MIKEVDEDKDGKINLREVNFLLPRGVRVCVQNTIAFGITVDCRAIRIFGLS